MALVLALLSLLTSGWLWWQLADESQDGRLSGLESTLGEVTGRQDSLEQRIAGVDQQLASAGQSIDSGVMNNRLRPLRQSLDSLSSESTALSSQLDGLNFSLRGNQDRLTNLERQLADLSVVRQGNDRQLAWAEIEYLLRLGNERLQLFGDRDAALRTLQLADRQLAAMNDPVLLRIRQQLQQDIQSLVAMDMPDLIQIHGELLALEQAVPRWQLRQPEAPDDDAGVDEPGVLSRLGAALKSLVTVRRQAADEEPFLNLEEGEQLRDRIALQLQTARLAALRLDQDLYASSLGTSGDWLARYFDPENSASRAASAAVERLAAINLQPELPDISQSLRQMQYLNTAPAPAVAPAAGPAAQPEAASQQTESGPEPEAGEASTSGQPEGDSQ